MGYDNFALFSVAPGQNPDDDDFNSRFPEAVAVAKAASTNKQLFGFVHLLREAEFDETWQEEFNHFMAVFYEAYAARGGKMTTFLLYICEFDGESLRRRAYVRGKSDGTDTYITVHTSEPTTDVQVYPHIKSLTVQFNLTIYYNPDYDFDVC